MGSCDVQNENKTNVIFLFFISDSNKAARYKRYGLCVCNKQELKILRMFYSLLEYNISFESFVETFYEVVKKFNLKTDCGLESHCLRQKNTANLLVMCIIIMGNKNSSNEFLSRGCLHHLGFFNLNREELYC